MAPAFRMRFILLIWCMDGSVTEANLNNAAFQWGCNLATRRSVLVQLCLGKMHLFSGAERCIQSVTDAKGERLGAGPRTPPSTVDWPIS